MDALLARLNALRTGGEASDVFRVDNGVLRAFVDRAWRASPSFLGVTQEAIATHIGRHENVSVGLEIGAGVAKLLAKSWTLGANGPVTYDTIADVKLELAKVSQMKALAIDYPAEIGPIVQTLGAFGWRVPPDNFDIADPAKLLKGCPPNAGFTYVYGTQGPRAARRALGRNPIPEMRVLSGDEEGLLIFDSVVPAGHARAPGTMVIEIGSGSTELVLVDRARHRHAITVAIGGQSDAGLADIVKGIEEGHIARHAANYLESEPSAASPFSVVPPGAAMFMNPNRGSENLRAKMRRAPGSGELDVAAALRFSHDHPDGEGGRKARILGSLAQAFGFDVILEGKKGGLKEGVAIFVGAALRAARSTSQQKDRP